MKIVNSIFTKKGYRIKKEKFTECKLTYGYKNAIIYNEYLCERQETEMFFVITERI